MLVGLRSRESEGRGTDTWNGSLTGMGRPSRPNSWALTAATAVSSTQPLSPPGHVTQTHAHHNNPHHTTHTHTHTQREPTLVTERMSGTRHTQRWSSFSSSLLHL